ncbi:MAG: AbrB/MazE/SpoVT family DNA-binding domain-containing protein [Bacillota bacterium]
MVKKTLGACKVSTKGQVTIPSEARKLFQLTTGDLLLFTEEDGKLVLVKG